MTLIVVIVCYLSCRFLLIKATIVNDDTFKYLSSLNQDWITLVGQVELQFCKLNYNSTSIQ